MNSINLIELIPRCHQAAKAKGFWGVTPNRSQMLMLVVSELSEALEADRKHRRADLRDYEIFAASDPKLPSEFRQRVQVTSFLENVKDTVEDELADAYIRLCDFVGGFGLDAEEVAGEHETLDCPDNFGEALLGITAIVCMVDYELDGSERTVGMALAHIEALCEKMDIDLPTHIDLKLAYNATRPAKHGKAY